MPIHDLAARLHSVELFAGLPLMSKAEAPVLETV